MKLPDVNLWLAAAIASHRHHPAAKQWLDAQDAPASIAFCRITQQGFLRLLTHEPFMRGCGLKAMTNARAWSVWQAFTADDRIVFQPEPAGMESRWRSLGARSPASPKLWMDAYLAAFAIESGMKLVTFDRGFRQFRSLQLELLHE